MGADLDVCESYVSIKSYSSRQPYIDASGLTSLNIPVESVEWTEVMFEAKVGEISTGKVTLPSLIAFPELRPLLQNIKEGDRIEIYGFQPDCGDPVMAGFIPVNGITEQDGKVTLDFDDTLGQLRWQHLKRFEYLNDSAGGLYDRSRSIWVDLVNADFTDATASSDFTFTNLTGSMIATWGGGFVQFMTPTSAILSPTNQLNKIIFAAGDTYVMECDATMTVDWTDTNGMQLLLRFVSSLVLAPTDQLGATLSYAGSGVTAFPDAQSAGAVLLNNGVGHVGLNRLNQVGLPSIQTHHLTSYFHVNFDGTASIYFYLDNIMVDFYSGVWPLDGTTFTPSLFMLVSTSIEKIQVSSWRVSKLIPVLNRAGRFNPQTTDALAYQPNNEENLQFLQLIAEKDNAEYRPIYHAWPATDDLEIDATGALGKFASRLLGYEQPPALPTEGSPQTSPAPVILDAASFLVTPPFRMEEGYNLESVPKVLPRANAHANDVIRVGASSIDSQVFSEKWLTSELGRPQHSPSGAQYPRFEQIVNDDRVGIQSLIQTLNGLDVARRTDPTPSLEVAYVEELPWAFRWRGGDQVLTKTLSLRNNVEQELRAQKIQYKAGSPVRVVTLGKTDWDASMLRQLSESMKISWLYEQSGTNPGIYVYPSVGSIASGASSADFTIPLDKYTTGSSLVYAAIHWFADANVLNLQPFINGSGVDLSGITAASGTESGLVVVTSCFQAIGTYKVHFLNNDANPRNLTGAFLVLRIKG
jgi:hypothetical protein